MKPVWGKGSSCFLWTAKIQISLCFGSLMKTYTVCILRRYAFWKFLSTYVDFDKTEQRYRLICWHCKEMPTCIFPHELTQINCSWFTCWKTTKLFINLSTYRCFLMRLQQATLKKLCQKFITSNFTFCHNVFNYIQQINFHS